MAEPKTRPTDASVDDFIAGVADDRRRAEAASVATLMSEVTGERATMWGASIVGFGRRHYLGSGGRAVEWPVVAFSPRKAQLVVYLMDGFEKYGELLDSLGPHSTGKACLYLKRLDAVDHQVLRELIRHSYEHTSSSDA